MSRTETHIGKIRVITRTTKDTIEHINKNLSEYWVANWVDKLSECGRIYIDETKNMMKNTVTKSSRMMLLKSKTSGGL